MVYPKLTYGRDMRAVGLIVAGILLTGCSAGGDTQNASEPPPSVAIETPPVPEPTKEAEPETSNEPRPCEDVMFQRAQGTIRAQQSAFAASDYEAARAYASNGFRSTVSVEQFQQIIEGDYAFLLNDPTLTFTECRRRGDSALIRVDVSGSPVTVMVYGVVLENDSWFIDAATVAGVRQDVTT